MSPAVGSSVSRSVSIPAPPAAVWAVLADFGAIARWAPDVDHSSLLHGAAGSGAGVGTVRRVQVGRSTLLETVVTWAPPERLAYEIAGLPPVVRHAANDWRLRPAAGGTDVTLTSTVDAGHRPPQRLVARLVAARLARASSAMLRGLTAAVAVSTTGPTTTGGRRG